MSGLTGGEEGGLDSDYGEKITETTPLPYTLALPPPSPPSHSSVQADIPFKRIGTLFNVTNFIVCQCNFHVVPFLNKSHHPTRKSWYWRIFQTLEWDIRNRVLNLSRLGLFPKLFGQDISKVFKQKYHGNVTIVPRMNMMQIIGVKVRSDEELSEGWRQSDSKHSVPPTRITNNPSTRRFALRFAPCPALLFSPCKALLNPTVEDMQHYLQSGQMAVWPYIDLIKHLLSVEESLASCISTLEADLNIKRSHVGVGGITMYESKDGRGKSRNGRNDRSASRGRELELMRVKMKGLEEENKELRERVRKFQLREKEYRGEDKREGEGEGGNFADENVGETAENDDYAPSTNQVTSPPTTLEEMPSSPGWTTVSKKHKKSNSVLGSFKLE